MSGLERGQRVRVTKPDNLIYREACTPLFAKEDGCNTWEDDMDTLVDTEQTVQAVYFNGVRLLGRTYLWPASGLEVIE